jgi:hypothetical protein
MTDALTLWKSLSPLAREAVLAHIKRLVEHALNTAEECHSFPALCSMATEEGVAASTAMAILSSPDVWGETGAEGSTSKSDPPVSKRADAPDVSERYVTHKNTIYDRASGLTWQRFEPFERFTFAEAQEYALKLELDGGGWRVPTLVELRTFDHLGFSDCPAEWFWTSTLIPEMHSSAWIVHFNCGGGASDGDILGSYRVRCVRE